MLLPSLPLQTSVFQMCFGLIDTWFVSFPALSFMCVLRIDVRGFSRVLRGFVWTAPPPFREGPRRFYEDRSFFLSFLRRDLRGPTTTAPPLGCEGPRRSRVYRSPSLSHRTLVPGIPSLRSGVCLYDPSPFLQYGVPPLFTRRSPTSLSLLCACP